MTYYEQNKERILERQRKYNHKHKKEQSVASKKRYLKNKDKINARNRAYYKKNYVKMLAKVQARRKIPIPIGQICENCNKEKATIRHHEDYSKPLEVKFVCRSCNNRLG
jgi:ATP-dependent 26S proteasome regulatory subunit